MTRPLIPFLLTALLALAGCSRAAPFDPAHVPPAPDYSQPNAWLAFPGREGIERSTPPGMAAVDEAAAPADVFFIHPTTYLRNDVWNADYDAVGANAPYNGPVLLNQVSAFNGCCRLYAPQYRQASLMGLSKSEPAVDLAYGDVAAAFRWYIAHENNGRPFILASHSQGTAHLIRLLQQEVLGTPLQKRLVAVYAIGGFTPDSFASLGLPTCETARQTGCIVSWNTAQAGRKGARMIIDNHAYWWRGAHLKPGPARAICVNPLTWNETGAAPASANPGSLPFPPAPFPTKAGVLPALTPHLTGAQCRDGLLTVDIPGDAPKGFHDTISLLTGSYHLTDYGVFYAAIRANAVDRVAAWKAGR